MFAQVVIFCTALAAVHASLVEPLGFNAPVLAAGSLGYGKGLIAAPAVATISSQRTAINHVAPASGVAAAAPLGIAAPLVGGPVLAARPLGVGRELVAAVPAVSNVSTQKTAINHVAPAAPIAAVAPLGYADPVAATVSLPIANGVIAGNGIVANGLVGQGFASPFAVGNGLLGAHYGLGVGRIGLGKVIL